MVLYTPNTVYNYNVLMSYANYSTLTVIVLRQLIYNCKPVLGSNYGAREERDREKGERWRSREATDRYHGKNVVPDNFALPPSTQRANVHRKS